MAHVLERKLEGNVVPMKEAKGAVSCGFAAPTCALHNLYPLSEGIRRLLTDGQSAAVECMVLPDEKLADIGERNLRSREAKPTAARSHGTRIGTDADKHGSTGTEEGSCRLWKPLRLELTRAEYEAQCAALFNRGVAPVTRLLEYLDLRADEIDEVVMVGGMTRTPRVREMLKLHLGVNRLNVDIDPDIVVAYGAATIAH